MTMPDTEFQKRVEDFMCEACGMYVVGGGYTNHCPACLVSKHVDVHPGDRAADCGGLMRVVKIDLKDGEWRLLHRCRRCGYEKRNKVSAEDSQERLAEVVQEVNKQKRG
ncbi:MAG: RNHCP domain-containing protein [Patescibacteria group bacterium]